MDVTPPIEGDLEHAAFDRRRREREALEKTFRDLEFRVGKRTGKREDLYARS